MAPDAKIPVIDISDPALDEREGARQLVDAAADHGFIYIRNLGRDISVDQVDNAFDLVLDSLITSFLPYGSLLSSG